MKKPQSFCPGTAEYDTDGGVHVMLIHYTADPAKADQRWIDEAAELVAPGLGRLSADWAQEMDLDDAAEDADLTYWAFHRDRNICEPFDINPQWPIYCGWDFGQSNATSCVFLAHDIDACAVYVFDSIYQPKGIDIGVKELFYAKLSAHLGLSIDDLALAGAHRFLAGNYGDPSGNAYAAFYAMEPLPIAIQTRLEGINLQLNDVAVGEARVNAALSPSFVCCNKHQLSLRDAPDQEKPCIFCRKPRPGRPILYVMRGRAPQLADQLEAVAKKPTPADGSPVSEKKNVGEDHAVDSLRYVMMMLPWREIAETRELVAYSADRIAELRRKPAQRLSDTDAIALERDDGANEIRAANRRGGRQLRPRYRTLRMGVRRGTDHLRMP